MVAYSGDGLVDLRLAPVRDVSHPESVTSRELTAQTVALPDPDKSTITSSAARRPASTVLEVKRPGRFEGGPVGGPDGQDSVGNDRSDVGSNLSPITAGRPRAKIMPFLSRHTEHQAALPRAQGA